MKLQSFTWTQRIALSSTICRQKIQFIHFLEKTIWEFWIFLRELGGPSYTRRYRDISCWDVEAKRYSALALSFFLVFPCLFADDYLWILVSRRMQWGPTLHIDDFPASLCLLYDYLDHALLTASNNSYFTQSNSYAVCGIAHGKVPKVIPSMQAS